MADVKEDISANKRAREYDGHQDYEAGSGNGVTIAGEDARGSMRAAPPKSARVAGGTVTACATPVPDWGQASPSAPHNGATGVGSGAISGEQAVAGAGADDPTCSAAGFKLPERRVVYKVKGLNSDAEGVAPDGSRTMPDFESSVELARRSGPSAYVARLEYAIEWTPECDVHKIGPAWRKFVVPAESESGAAAPQQGSAPAAAPPAAAPGGAGGLAWKPSVTEAQKAEFSLEFAHFVNQTLLSLRKAEISASEARNAVAAAQAKSAGKLPASVTAAQLGKKLLNKMLFRVTGMQFSMTRGVVRKL